MQDRKSNYVIISPAKDEEKYIETTINSVLRQTEPPSRWIFVDDGSCDKTPTIIANYSKEFSWITLLSVGQPTKRETGVAEIKAFRAGYESIKNTDFEYVVKLDCDLKLAPDYFHELITRFREDEKLGIASGIYLEHHGKDWSPVQMPGYHAAGASKMVRARCFEDIGGFVTARGWDTVDEIRAQMLGWRTRHFPELKFYHLRREGSAMGLLRTSRNYGQTYYVTGGGKLFFLLKVLQRAIRGRPFVLSGVMMAFGYLKSWLSGEDVLVNAAEASFYRQRLNKRIVDYVSALFNVRKQAGYST